MEKKSRERGSFTIEAILALSVFMFAFITVVSMAAVAKAESTTQYAVDQVAKEISQYFYIAERAGLVKPEQGGEAADTVDEAIQSVFDFAQTVKDSSKKDQNSPSTSFQDISAIIGTFDKVSNDVASISAAAQNVSSKFGPILSDPKGIISSLAAMLKSSLSRTVVSKIIAQPLCKALTPKYITSNGDDDILEKMGVVGGLHGLDFRMSSFLADGRSINVVVIYQLKVNGFGVFDQTLLIKQTASTAAWVTGMSLSEALNSSPSDEPDAGPSLWSLNDLDRGSAFVALIKEQSGGNGVASGCGIDVYDQSTNTFTEVHSMNVFMKSYSDYANNSEAPESVDNYSLKESKIKSQVKSYANKLLSNMGKIDAEITMEDGRALQTGAQNRNAVLIMVAPIEVKDNASNLEILSRIAQQLREETGVSVEWIYKDTALGT